MNKPMMVIGEIWLLLCWRLQWMRAIY